MKLIVNIGSKNPIKIKATQEAFSSVFPETDFIFRSFDIKTSVASTPISDEEMISGAMNRAEKSLINQSAFGVGIEGGIDTNDFGTFLKAWVVILTENNQIGIGASPAIMFPKSWTNQISSVVELAEVVDNNAKTKNIKQKEGAFGILTNNLIIRKDALKLAIISALSVIHKKELFS